jgi:hypothetical protein
MSDNTDLRTLIKPRKQYYYMKYYIILLILVSVILVSGCSQTPQIKDCKYDKNCFLDAVISCSPAKVRLMENTSSSGLSGIKIIMQQEIRGLEDGNCIYYVKVEELRFSSDFPSDLISELGMDRWEGTEMTCRIPSFETFNEIPTTNELYDFCEGTFKTRTDETLQKVRDYLEESVTKHFLISDYYCTDSIKVHVLNSGTNTIYSPDDFVVDVDSSDASAGLTDTILEPGDSELILDWNCGSRCQFGMYEVHIETVSYNTDLMVTCSGY